MWEPAWQDGSLSVIVLPAGEAGDGLLAVARQWTAAWLLSPAIWIRAEDVPGASEGPPEVRGLVLGRDNDGLPAEAEIEVFWKLGQQHRPLVRLLAVRMIQPEADRMITQQAIARLDQYLERALPTELVGADKDGIKTELLRLNLIIDAAERSGLDPDHVFQASWNANIVASPEDRSSPASPDSPPIHPRTLLDLEDEVVPGVKRRAARYYGWALAHVATAAGLWSGLPKSAYDLMPPRPSVAHRMCLVQRVAVRGVLTDGLAITLAEEAMEVATDKTEASRRLTQMAMQTEHGVLTFSDAEVPDRSRAMVELVLEGFRGEGFGYRPFADPGPYVRPTTSLGSRLRLLLSLGTRATISIPRFMVQLVVRRASSKLTIEDGDAVVVAEPTWNGGLPTVDDGIFTAPAVPPPTLVGLRSSPQVWRDLRDLVLASLDAKPGITIGEVQLKNESTGDRMVFPSRTDVLPDPDESWMGRELDVIDAPDLPTIGWMDEEVAESTLTRLDALYDVRLPHLYRLRSEFQAADRELTSAQQAIEHETRIAREAHEDLQDSHQWLKQMQADHPHTEPHFSFTYVSEDVDHGA